MKHLHIDFPNLENQRYESLSREELDEEILLQTKRNELFRLQMEQKFIFDRNTCIIEPMYKSIGNNLNKTVSKIERKKHSYGLEDILMIVFVSCFLTAMVITIILT